MLFGSLDFVVRRVIEIFHILLIERRNCCGKNGRRLTTTLKQFQFAKTAFQTLTTAAQRLINRFGRRGKSSLQYRQRKTDGACTLIVFEGLRAVELVAHIISHRPVELCLGIRQLIRYGVGNTLRKQRRTIEFEERLFNHPAHEIGDIRHVDAVAEATLEAIAIEQRHKQLEVFFLAVVRRRRHQQKVPRECREKLAQPVTLGVFGFAAKYRGGHFVRFIANHEIPAAIGGLEL